LTTWMLSFLFMIFGLQQFCLSSVFGPAGIMVKCLG
jgi:TM2 domain-containing membrane protein YozV